MGLAPRLGLLNPWLGPSTEAELIQLCVCVFVGSYLATKVFIGNLPAMGRGWVIIKQWSRKQSRVAGATDTSCGCGFDY